MNDKRQKLIEAEKLAEKLFETIIERGLITVGKTENTLNEEMFLLAKELFNIEKYWHKRIVRCGTNTLLPYKENPENLIIKNDDILFLDFGPIIDEWEADYGRTYVVGNDTYKLKLKNDVEQAWLDGNKWFKKQECLTGAQFFEYISGLAKKYQWDFGGEIAGHLIGEFPHEKLEPGNYNLYIHPDNHNDLFLLDENGNKREWILEIHFVDREKQIGGFFEQLLG